VDAAGYRASYGANYRVWFCSQNGPHPRQHWVFAHSSSPTTRPPRENRWGGLRVVGLEVCVVEVLAGVGPHRRSDTWEKGNRMGENMKKEERQIHDQADRETKAGEDRQGGWDRLVSGLAFGCVGVVG
jgi:hypothetical protein